MGSIPSLKQTWVAASEAQRTERILAAARAFLALALLVAVWLNPPEPSRYAPIVFGLLAVYAFEAIGILALVRTQPSSSAKFRLTIHAVDILWPTLISVFAAGPSSPFYLIYTFVLLEAAYRWGMQATLATALITTILFISQAVVASLHLTSFLPVLQNPFGINSFIVGGVYLLLMGYLLGYLADEEKHLREEIASVAGVMTKVRSEMGLRGALRAIFLELFRLFRTEHGLLTVRDHNSGRAFVWEAQHQPSQRDIVLTSSELNAPELTESLLQAPGHVWHLVCHKPKGDSRSYDIFALDEEGRRLFDAKWSPNETLVGGHKFQSLLGVRVNFADEWSGTLLLFDPNLRSSREAALRFLRALTLQVAPAIYGVFLTSRLRTKAGAIERARVARELHDGVIQSMIGLEMEVDVLRRQPNNSSSGLSDRLGHIQRVLRQEVVNLRELMQQMKPLELRPTQLLDFLATLVDKFGRDTGISSRFVSTLTEVALPPRVCNELARIAQEALVNARKHSGAQSVLVQLGYQDGRLKLAIDDDGHGFDFLGRLGMADLDTARKGPVTIKERVRSIGGELVVESFPGKGSRVEVTLSQRAHG